MPDGATVKTSKAAVGFQYCNKLFAEERKCVLYKPQYRKEYRQNRELPLLEEYFAWLNTVHPEKGSKLEEAVRYSINQKQHLCAFLDNGEIPISNNLAENAIRPFTLGRKNWLFCDTPKGAEASAVVYSLVESAKANGIEPFAYLQHVLVQLPYFGKSPSHEELETLMPWAPDIQQDHKPEACRFGYYRAVVERLRLRNPADTVHKEQPQNRPIPRLFLAFSNQYEIQFNYLLKEQNRSLSD